jgi:hypothetical protein
MSTEEASPCALHWMSTEEASPCTLHWMSTEDLELSFTEKCPLFEACKSAMVAHGTGGIFFFLEGKLVGMLKAKVFEGSFIS